MFLLKGKGQIVHFAMFYYGKGMKIVQNAMFLVKSCILQCVWGKLVVKPNPLNLSNDPLLLTLLLTIRSYYIVIIRLNYSPYAHSLLRFLSLFLSYHYVLLKPFWFLDSLDWSK